jgi:hypothetical protein
MPGLLCPEPPAPARRWGPSRRGASAAARAPLHPRCVPRSADAEPRFGRTPHWGRLPLTHAPPCLRACGVPPSPVFPLVCVCLLWGDGAKKVFGVGLGPAPTCDRVEAPAAPPEMPGLGRVASSLIRRLNAVQPSPFKRTRPAVAGPPCALLPPRLFMPRAPQCARQHLGRREGRVRPHLVPPAAAATTTHAPNKGPRWLHAHGALLSAQPSASGRTAPARCEPSPAPLFHKNPTRVLPAAPCPPCPPQPPCPPLASSRPQCGARTRMPSARQSGGQRHAAAASRQGTRAASPPPLAHGRRGNNSAAHPNCRERVRNFIGQPTSVVAGADWPKRA